MRQQARLSAFNSIVNTVGVVAVAFGVWVAKDTLDSIDESIDVSKEAVRLEHRAWLGYAGFTLQTLPGNASSDEPWKNREISAPGDIARFRVSVVNSGRTPALNVTLSTGNGNVVFPGHIIEPPTKWRARTEPQRGVVVMPGEQERYLYTPYLLLHPSFIKDYMSGSAGILLWTRLQYCDIYQRRHWALIAVVRQSGSRPDGHFTLPEQHFGPADGEPGHPYCQNIVQDAP